MTRDRIRLCLEKLEGRDLLSASTLPVEPLLVPATHGLLPAAMEVPPPPHHPGHAHPGIQFQAGKESFSGSSRSPNSSWFTPDQIRQAYGFDKVPSLMLKGTTPDTATYNNTAGKGQTLAIIDVYDDPKILSDANVFSSQFGLPQFNTGGPTFVKLNENGQNITSEPKGVPHPQTNSAWSSEISLDVEWAHAIAPQANIVLVEANSESTGDVFKAMNVARNNPAVSVVSMSWGYNESNSNMRSNLPAYDAAYLTPPAGTGHTPITFVAATLDNGSRYGVFWPAISPNVLAVGGTNLTTDATGNYLGESGWSYSTGGISKYEKEPSYQNGVQSTGWRTNPDVAYAATGFATYDTAGSYTGWFSASGTSAGTPQWAGLVALADQGRQANGLQSLSSTQTLDALYQFAGSNPSYFNDIVSGSNGAYQAGSGYDLVTGIGTPKADQLIPALGAWLPPS